jgi:ornithine carbamoyltransferase
MAQNARKKRDFLRLIDLSREELLALIERAAEWKLLGKNGPRPLERLNVGLIFEKASTRTRVSFQVGIHQMGGSSLVLPPNELQIGRGEPVKDTARCLARYLDALVVRTFQHSKLEEIAQWCDVPVVNALTDLCHPCQLMADLLTVTERLGADALRRSDLEVAWVGDGHNMANSWLEACCVLGFSLRLACPEGYDPNAELLARAGSRARLVRSPREAVQGAHVLNTDVWASMGQEAEVAERRRKFAGYILDRELVALADPRAMVMHCLPAKRGEEISDEVIEGPQSAVFDEAENRLHGQKAVLELLLA